MYRIDNNSTAATLPVIPPAGTPGFFTGGDPSIGLQATRVDAWWANMLQEEILAVVTAAGLTPNKTDNRQLLESLNALYVGPGSLNRYLPLAGGQMTGFPLLLARDPVQPMEAATRQFVLAQVGGVTPTGFLPLTGGTIYNPGGDVPLTIETDQGHSASIRYVKLGGSGTGGASNAYTMGCAPDGRFIINDSTYTAGNPPGPFSRLIINTNGVVEVLATLQIDGQGINYNGLGGTNNIGFVWSGTQLVGYVNGNSIGALATGNFLPITGGTLTGPLAISGSNNLNVGGSTVISGGLQVTGGTTMTGAVQLGNNLAVNYGSVNVGGQIAVNNNLISFTNAGYTGSVCVSSLNRHGWGMWALDNSAGSELDWGFVDAYGNSQQQMLQLYQGSGLILPWGDAWKPGGGTWEVYGSSRALKRDIEDWNLGLDRIRALHPVSFRYNDAIPSLNDDRTHVGLISEEVQEVWPELVGELATTEMIDGAARPLTVPTLNVDPITYALINAVKTLADRLDKLETH